MHKVHDDYIVHSPQLITFLLDSKVTAFNRHIRMWPIYPGLGLYSNWFKHGGVWWIRRWQLDVGRWGQRGWNCKGHGLCKPVKEEVARYRWGWQSAGMNKVLQKINQELRQCTNIKSNSSGGGPHRPWRNVDLERGQVHLGFASVYLPPSSSTLRWSCTR